MVFQLLLHTVMILFGGDRRGYLANCMANEVGQGQSKLWRVARFKETARIPILICQFHTVVIFDNRVLFIVDI